MDYLVSDSPESACMVSDSPESDIFLQQKPIWRRVRINRSGVRQNQRSLGYDFGFPKVHDLVPFDGVVSEALVVAELVSNVELQFVREILEIFMPGYMELTLCRILEIGCTLIGMKVAIYVQNLWME